MKNTVRIAGMLLILLVTGQALEAQRGMRNLRNDTTFMKQSRDSVRMQMAGRRMAPPQDFRRGEGRMYPGMAHQGMRNGDFGYGRRMNQGMRQHGMMRPGMMQPGFQGGRGQGMMAYGRGMGEMMENAPGRRIMESMPGVTAKQKEELKKLNESQLGEMKKLREKHLEAVKSLRDQHQKKVQGLLTDEQKKWLEENGAKGQSR